MRIIISLIVILLSLNSASANEIIDLYQAFRPQKVKQYPKLMESENLKFEQYAQLNPQLIYFYINTILVNS